MEREERKKGGVAGRESHMDNVFALKFNEGTRRVWIEDI